METLTSLPSSPRPRAKRSLFRFVTHHIPPSHLWAVKLKEGKNMQQIQWQDRFSIGVDIIDQAHRKLFAIVEKIMDLYVEKHENRFACVEGIKYFKAYALKHFAEEEAYMRKTEYPGYLAHKRHHDRMRRETLPALERMLYATDFSTEAVQRFIGVCTGWLTGHIIIEDRAITGKNPQASLVLQAQDEQSVINGVIIQPLQEMFETEIQHLGEFSLKDAIADAQYYELTYRALQGYKLRFTLVIGEQLLFHAASLMFGMDFYARNEIVRFAIQEIAQSLILRAAASYGDELDAYQLESDRFLTGEEFERRFQEQPPRHSLLFGVKQNCFALCVDQLPEPA